MNRKLVSLTVGTILSASSVHAGCNCNKGSSVGYESTPAPYAASYPAANGMPTQGPQPGSPVLPISPYSAVLGAGPVYSGVMTGSIAPPPGTLGQTYQRSSRPVPADKHPRAGLLEVRAPGAVDVAVYDVENFRIEDRVDGFRNQDDPAMWHFESKPLTPGLTHIYRVIIRRGPGKDFEERYVRLVMGRVVSVEF